MVGRCDVIVLIRLDAPLCVLYVKIKLFQLSKYLSIDWYSVISDDNATFERNIFNSFAPVMAEDLLYIVTLMRIYVQDTLEQIFELIAHEGRQNVLS